MRQEEIKRLEETAKAIRRNIVEMIGPEAKGHFGGSLSLADIVAVLYFHTMRFDGAHPDDPARDRFLLSKGHAAPVQYAALAQAGVIPIQELKTFKDLGSRLQGHPDSTKLSGIEANTGSLGQGLSIAAGMAAGLRLQGLPGRVYCIMGDGEQAEGQIWEAAMAASAFQLSNLTGIIDRNCLQATGFTRDRFNTGDLAAKWAAFGWRVIECDGHDVAKIAAALDEAKRTEGGPSVVIAHTTKGKGLPCAENNPDFHNAQLTRAQYEEAVRLLGGKLA